MDKNILDKLVLDKMILDEMLFSFLTPPLGVWNFFDPHQIFQPLHQGIYERSLRREKKNFDRIHDASRGDT